MDLPPRKRPRDPILASEWNQILDALEALGNVQTGAGLSATVGANGLTLALVGRHPGYITLGKITAAPPAGVIILPSNCRYSAAAMGRGWVVTNQFPVYGRRVENDECGIYPAKVGDFCAIYRNVRTTGQAAIAELEVFTEKEARGPCP